MIRFSERCCLRANLVILGVIAPSCALLISGCVFHAPADSRVIVQPVESMRERGIEFGLREAYSKGAGNNIEVLALGIHPREHEQYAFFLSEPNPVFWTRVLSLHRACDGAAATIDLWLDRRNAEIRSWYSESIQDNDRLLRFAGQSAIRACHQDGSTIIDIQDAILRCNSNRDARLRISGRVVARHCTDHEFKNFTIRVDGFTKP